MILLLGFVHGYTVRLKKAYFYNYFGETVNMGFGVGMKMVKYKNIIQNNQIKEIKNK